MISRPQHPPSLFSGQGSGAEDSAPGRDRIRDALAIRCAEAEAHCPEALDLCAEALAALHDELSGCASEARIRGPRAPKYHREQLRGEHATTVEDLARYSMEAPRALIAIVRVLALRCGHRVEPIDHIPVRLSEASALVSERHSAVEASLHRAQDDGRVDPVEAGRIRAKLRGMKHAVTALDASLAKIEGGR